MAHQSSTRLSHDEYVGVKCNWTRGWAGRNPERVSFGGRKDCRRSHGCSESSASRRLSGTRRRGPWPAIAHALDYHGQMHTVHDSNRLSGGSPILVDAQFHMFVPTCGHFRISVVFRNRWFSARRRVRRIKASLDGGGLPKASSSMSPFRRGRRAGLVIQFSSLGPLPRLNSRCCSSPA